MLHRRPGYVHASAPRHDDIIKGGRYLLEQNWLLKELLPGFLCVLKKKFGG